MKQKIYKSLTSVPRILKTLTKAESVFLVTGKKSFTECGAEAVLSEALHGKRIYRFSDFSVNPKLEDVEKGIRLLKENPVDIALAVGGGSVLDMAKMINLFAAQDLYPREAIVGGAKILVPGKPMIAVPTTSGSGSEATHFAVVYVDGKKYSLASPFLLPDYVILDYRLTKAAPYYVRAASGLDALAQSVESYWNIYSTGVSRGYSSKAISLVLENLVPSLHTPTVTNLKAMQMAAHYGGKAINITKTTAPHALSYYFTTTFGLAHGHAVGLTLGNFFEINSLPSKDNLNDPRGTEHVMKIMKELFTMLGVKEAEEAKSRIGDIMKEIGLETDYNVLGIKPYHVEELIKSVNIERLVNNPVKVKREDILSIFSNLRP